MSVSANRCTSSYMGCEKYLFVSMKATGWDGSAADDSGSNGGARRRRRNDRDGDDSGAENQASTQSFGTDSSR